MISKEQHKKHGDLQKANLGNFSRNEVAIYGTTCEDVAAIVKRIRSLFPEYNVGFADADHHENTETFTGSHWQRKSDVLLIEKQLPDNVYQHRTDLSHVDLMLVNGNHFQAAKQLVICNSAKEDSLRRRADQLTHVVAVLNLNRENISKGNIPDLLPLDNVAILNNDEELKTFIVSEFLQPPHLSALIMAGGRSIRMGKDKTVMRYHDEEQFLHVYNMFLRKNIKPYISCRPDQREFFESKGCDVIVDRISDMGPLGGIISAFMSYPDEAFFVLACDLPLVTEDDLEELITARIHSHTATAFLSPHDKFPEPLIAIWEPKSYPVIMQFVAQGYSCPRKVLINSNSLVIKSSHPDRLMNVNTMDDYRDATEVLS